MGETIYYIKTDSLFISQDYSITNTTNKFDYFIYTYEKDGEIKNDYTNSLWN